MYSGLAAARMLDRDPILVGEVVVVVVLLLPVLVSPFALLGSVSAAKYSKASSSLSSLSSCLWSLYMSPGGDLGWFSDTSGGEESELGGVCCCWSEPMAVFGESARAA